MLNKKQDVRRIEGLVGSLLTAAGLSVFLKLEAGSIANVLFCICLVLMWNAPPFVGNTKSSVILSAAYAVILTLGGFSEYAAQEKYPLFQVLKVVCVFAGALMFFLRFLPLLLSLTVKKGNPVQNGREKRKKFALFFVLLLICWLPYYLALFPGRLSGDSVDQIRQAFGWNTLTNQHPAIHTVLIAVFCRLGKLVTGTMNGGVAFYTTFQALAGAAVFAYTLTVLCDFGLPRAGIIAGVCFYGIVLFNPWYSLTMWKDVPFGLIMLLITVRLTVMMKKDRVTVKEWLTFGVLGLLLCLFRHSGLFAFLVMTPLLAVRWKRERKSVLITCSAALISAFLIYVPVYDSLGIYSSDTIEAFSVPAQQIARVYYEELPLTEEENEMIARLADTSRIASEYREDISDPIKNLVRATGDQSALENEPVRYLGLWVRLGLRYPMTYLRAWVAQTKSFWFPCTQAADDLVNTGIDGSELGIVTQSLLPAGVQDLLIDVSRQHARFPLYGNLCSIGLYSVLLIFAIAMFKTKGRSALPCGFVLFNLFLILLGTPVAHEFRYAWNMIITVPFLLPTALLAGKSGGKPETEQRPG